MSPNLDKARLNSLPRTKVERTNTMQGRHEQIGQPLAQIWVIGKSGQRRRAELLVDERLVRGAVDSAALSR